MRLEALSKVISKDMFDEWVQHPVTEFVKLSIELKILEKKEYLENGSFIDSEKGLTIAAQVRGAKLALEDILDIDFGDDEGEHEDDNTSGA